jgi:Na+/phosphate symporter
MIAQGIRRSSGTLNVTAPKLEKAVHIKDVSRLASDVKSIRNDVKDYKLTASGKNKVGDQIVRRDFSGLNKQIERVGKKIENNINSINGSSYNHNPKKMEKLQKLLADVKSLGRDVNKASDSEKFNQKMSDSAKESKVRSHQQRQDRAKLPGDNYNGGFVG